VSTAVQQASSVFEDDPFDVDTVHLEQFRRHVQEESRGMIVYAQLQSSHEGIGYSSAPDSASLPISRNSMRTARSRCSWVNELPSSAARNAARRAALRM